MTPIVGFTSSFNVAEIHTEDFQMNSVKKPSKGESIPHLVIRAETDIMIGITVLVRHGYTVIASVSIYSIDLFHILLCDLKSQEKMLDL